MLLACNRPSAQISAFDFSFMKNQDLRDLRPRKRGRRGGVRIRLRRRRFRPPLPSIVLGNAQSLWNKSDELAACCKFLHEFRDASVLCFSETWLKADDSDPVIPGFNVYRCDRSEAVTGKSRGGGVCIFVNSRWCTNVTVKEAFCHEDVELLSVALRPFYLPREFNQLFITVVYIHPKANIKKAADTVAGVVHRLASKSPDAPSFIVGDFNKCRLNKVLPTFKQYVTCSTCGDRTLDLCYGNIRDAFQSRPLPNLGRSIHQMVQLIPLYRQKLKRTKPVVRTTRVWNPESVDSLNGCFECTDWGVFLDEGSSLDEAADVISSYISFCVDLVLDLKEVKVYPNSRPWVSPDLRILLKERQSALRENNRPQMKLIQKRIDAKIKAEKKKYSDKLEDNFYQGNSRQCWQSMSVITGYKPEKADLRAEDEKKLADELNVFYCRFDCHDFKAEQERAMQQVHEMPSSPITFTDDDVRSLFKKLNARSASGPDGVSSRTLKMCRDSLAPVFSRLFQQSFTEGHVPRIWRSSIVVPVPKKRGASQLNDFRPVALTSVPMKCAERLVLKHLRKETAAHQDPLQFAYSQGRNTQDAILTLLHRLYEHLDQPGSHARLLFLDFSSAFNTLQPHLLVNKLLAMGVNPQLISWVHSFMTSRPQRVRVGSTLSDVLVTNTGAPQGCVLSPVLFTIYTADCRTADASSLQIKFADDTSLTGLLCDSDEAVYRQAVGELVDWCDSNYLELNVTKTEELIVDFRKDPGVVCPLVINGKEVRIVTTYKYLGTVIDDKLDWTPNIEACCKKASQRLFFLRKLRQFRVNSTILNLFFQSAVMPMLLYNQLCFFGSAKQADLEQMDRIIKAASAVIRQDTTPLAAIYHQTCARKVRAILDDHSHPLHASLSACESRRDSGRLRSMRCRTSRFRNSFVPTAIRTLNSSNPRPSMQTPSSDTE